MLAFCYRSRKNRSSALLTKDFLLLEKEKAPPRKGGAVGRMDLRPPSKISFFHLCGNVIRLTDG